jgi:alkanesulfonate monooxygenase SsuD/methylene tetrahydromethanopterin reductase-like flavin-dependent oxidoreductase (luciferase family)
MQQVGAFPTSQLGALEEATIAVRALLRGQRVTMNGAYVQLDGVELVHKPRPVPPLALGVRGPKSLRLSGRCADGTILCELSSPAYVRWAKGQIAAGMAEAERQDAHRTTVYAFCSVAEDREIALRRMRPQLAAFLNSPDSVVQVSHVRFAADVRELAERGGEAGLASDMPDAWITALTASGTPDEARAFVNGLIDAGADAVVLVPLIDQPDDPVMALASVLDAKSG